MIKIKKYNNILILLLLALTNSFALADFDSTNSSNKDNTSITTQRTSQEATSIFVVEALFANENLYPIEIWQNRDNEQINIFDIAREIKSIASLKEKIFTDVNDLDLSPLFKRLSQMEDIADRALLMEADKWKSSYVNELMKHIIGIRHAGISDLLPNAVASSNCINDKNPFNTINPCDENGQPWIALSHLADSTHEGPSITSYMQQHGTDIQLISNWWKEQMQSSWNPACEHIKIFYSNQRNLGPQTYYWGNLWSDSQEMKLRVENIAREESYTKALTIWHAYVQEALSKIKFNYNNQKNKNVCLIRTNGLHALKANNIKEFGKGYTMPSAVYESFSLINVFNGLHASAITESLVPYHRIIHMYPLLFNLHFHETEFVVLSGPDLPFDYFYNDDDDLSLLRENLKNGKGACTGSKVTRS